MLDSSGAFLSLQRVLADKTSFELLGGKSEVDQMVQANFVSSRKSD